MFKRSLLAAALVLTSFSAAAESGFYVVVPLQGRLGASAAINVSLGAYSLPAGKVGTPYAGFNLKTLLSVSGDPGYTGYGVKWSLASGSLPAGLTLNADGAISGTPTAGGTGTFSVKATYKTKSGQQAYQIFVTAVTVSLATATPPQAVVGTAYSFDLKSLLTVTGAAGYNGSGVTWSIVSGTLPAGLSLYTGAGLIAGTPTAGGDGPVTVRATYQGANGEQTYQLVSLDIKVALASTTLPTALRSQDYAPYDFRQLLTVTGDQGYDVNNVKFSIQANTSLPAGLTMSDTGTLSGVPSKIASYSFTVVASYKSKTAQQGYTITVGGVPLQVTALAAGNFHTCAITTYGGVLCWGQGTYGQLGNGSKASSLVPVPVSGLSSGVVAISAGNSHTCALTKTQIPKCWGSNYYGQLGNGATSDSATPVAISGLDAGVKSITVGDQFSCAVTTGGAAKCWGNNGQGQLGNNTYNYNANPTPVDVYGLSSGVTTLDAGNIHACALMASGGVKCWGYGTSGQLGNGGTTSSTTPVDVTGLTDVTAISAGSQSCAITTTGGVKCWGNNTNGQLGNNSTTSSAVPVDVYGLTSGVTAVQVGLSAYACAVTSSGGVKCWGQNQYGNLGTNNKTESHVPADVVNLQGATAISLSSAHGCAATSSGAKCWGYNTDGQLGDGTYAQSSTPVSVYQ